VTVTEYPSYPSSDPYGSGSGQPPGPYGAAPPNNNLVWGILVTILCCLPFGIVSIVKAAKVDSLWMSGRHEEAQAAAQSARNWAIAGVVAGPIVILLWFAIVGGAMFAEFSTSP